MVLPYAFAFALGCLTGFGYIARRFSGAAWKTACKKQGIIYMAINGGLSVAALYVIGLFEWTFVQGGTAEQESFVRVIVAGFGALALMRTRLSFPASDGGEALVGPGQTIDSILGELEFQVVENQATGNADEVSQVLEGLTYGQIGDGQLATICTLLVKNTRLADTVTPEQLDGLAEDIQSLEESEVFTDPTRVLILGLALNSVFRTPVLRAAVRALRAAQAQEVA